MLQRKSIYSMNTGSIYAMDIDRFIQEIKARPGIWEIGHPEHKNKLRVMRLWKEVQRSFPVVSIDDLKKRWKNMKDTFRKELKRLPQSKPGVFVDNLSSGWRHFDALIFLKDQFGFFQKEIEDPLQEGDKYLEEVSQSPASPASSISEDPLHGPTPSKRKAVAPIEKDVKSELLKIERKKMKILEEEVAKSNQYLKSDNYHFLMSLLPEMDKLGPVQKMRLRTKISQAVLDEVSMDNNYDDQQNYHEMPVQNRIQFQVIDPDSAQEVKVEAINMYE